MFDPAYPPNNAPLQSAPMRAQLNGLKDLIDAVSTITAAQIDAVNTLPAGSPASVAVSVSGGVLHFTFEIPQGHEGAPGATGSSGSDGQPGPPGQNGSDGATGPPFTNFQIDGVTTLNPGDNATVNANFDGTAVRLQFGIPRGDVGAQGMQGEVSNVQLQSAIDGSSANSNGVGTLSFGADPSYNAAQMQDVIAKVNELISALRR